MYEGHVVLSAIRRGALRRRIQITLKRDGLTLDTLNNPPGATADPAFTAGNGTYTINLKVKDLTVDGKTYRYFDFAKAVRN